MMRWLIIRLLLLYAAGASVGCADRVLVEDARLVRAPLYCYRTLAEVSCYATPQPRDRSRFIAAYLRD